MTEIESEYLKKCVEDNDCNDIFVYFNDHIKNIINKTCYNINNYDVEDLLNETYFELLNKDRYRLRKYNPSKCKLSSWIRLITIRTCYSYLAKKDPINISNKNRLETLEDVLETIADNFEGMKKIEFLYLLRNIEVFTNTLTTNERLILKCEVDHKLKINKIAKYLKIPLWKIYLERKELLKKMKIFLKSKGINIR